MDIYAHTYKLSRFALCLVAHMSGGAGIFFLWASFYKPFGAVFALMFLFQATLIALAMPQPAR